MELLLEVHVYVFNPFCLNLKNANFLLKKKSLKFVLCIFDIVLAFELILNVSVDIVFIVVNSKGINVLEEMDYYFKRIFKNNGFLKHWKYYQTFIIMNRKRVCVFNPFCLNFKKC